MLSVSKKKLHRASGWTALRTPATDAVMTYKPVHAIAGSTMTISAAEQRRQHRQRIDDAWALAKTGNETAYRELTMAKPATLPNAQDKAKFPMAC